MFTLSGSICNRDSASKDSAQIAAVKARIQELVQQIKGKKAELLEVPDTDTKKVILAIEINKLISKMMEEMKKLDELGLKEDSKEGKEIKEIVNSI